MGSNPSPPPTPPPRGLGMCLDFAGTSWAWLPLPSLSTSCREAFGTSRPGSSLLPPYPTPPSVRNFHLHILHALGRPGCRGGAQAFTIRSPLSYLGSLAEPHRSQRHLFQRVVEFKVRSSGGVQFWSGLGRMDVEIRALRICSFSALVHRLVLRVYQPHQRAFKEPGTPNTGLLEPLGCRVWGLGSRV